MLVLAGLLEVLINNLGLQTPWPSTEQKNPDIQKTGANRESDEQTENRQKRGISNLCPSLSTIFRVSGFSTV